MNKARKRVIDDIKNDKGLSNKSDPRWYWKARHYSEITFYWLNAFSFIVAIIIGLITQDFWKAIAILLVSQIYNLSQNLRGLVIHTEHLIEWTIKETV